MVKTKHASNRSVYEHKNGWADSPPAALTYRKRWGPGVPTFNYHVERIASNIQPVADAVTAAVATGALTLPWWRSYIHDMGSVAADLTPVLGGLWLIFRILHLMKHWSDSPPPGGED